MQQMESFVSMGRIVKYYATDQLYHNSEDVHLLPSGIEQHEVLPSESIQEGILQACH